MVKVYSEEDTCRSLEVTAGTTARHVCEMLVQKTHALHDDCWSLVEVFQHLALGEERNGFSGQRQDNMAKRGGQCVHVYMFVGIIK